VTGDYTWLAVFIVVGSMISLAYYLKVIAAIWMTPATAVEGAADAAAPPPGSERPLLAGGSDEATGLIAQGEVVAVAVVFGALTLILGVIPSPLFNVVRDVGAALGLL
jgi:NADH-quinone oxidoreductase subunit N